MKPTARGRPSVRMKLALGCEVRRIRDDSSNPTASTGVDRGQTGRCKTPVICRLARLEKRLDFGCATRNTTPQAPCTELHGRYRQPKELARNAENPGKTRVLQRRGQEPNFLVFSQYFLEVRTAHFRRELWQNSVRNSRKSLILMVSMQLMVGTEFKTES